MRVFYDTEFIERSGDLIPVSIGLKAETGRSLYRVHKSAVVLSMLGSNPWHRDNLVPQLPIKKCYTGGSSFSLAWDEDHPEYSCADPLVQIRTDVRSFLADCAEWGELQLWGDYAAYDHVFLARLFGDMVDWPHFLPMWTHDLQQLVESAGVGSWPTHLIGMGRAHHALDDAIETEARYNWLTSLPDAA